MKNYIKFLTIATTALAITMSLNAGWLDTAKDAFSKASAAVQSGAAADAASKGVGLGLKAAASNPNKGCDTMGTLGGGKLNALLVTDENRNTAATLCCDNAPFISGHPNAYNSLCSGFSAPSADLTLEEEEEELEYNE